MGRVDVNGMNAKPLTDSFLVLMQGVAPFPEGKNIDGVPLGRQYVSSQLPVAKVRSDADDSLSPFQGPHEMFLTDLSVNEFPPVGHV